ncbi:MAG: hypothetical protein KAT25_06695 [Sulfuriflexus sp.]|nr:hypothetical protein [Sulfuriflexus sp.]
MSIESVYMALAGIALILSIIFNRQSKPQWFVLKLVGVVASTVPIIGILQGGMFLEKDPPHSRACFLQAAVTITTYFILLYGFDIDML